MGWLSLHHPILSGFQLPRQAWLLTAPEKAEEVIITLPTTSQQQVLSARQVSAIVSPLSSHGPRKAVIADPTSQMRKRGLKEVK